MFSFRNLATSLILLLAFANAQADYPLTIEHAQGSLTLEQMPTRVVVFDLAALDTLDALGASVVGVPQLTGPEYLLGYQALPQVGTLFEPDYAAVEALKPDLIIVSGRSRAAYEQLSALAPTLDLSLGSEQFVEGVRTNLQRLGSIFAPQKAEQLDLDLQQALAALHENTQGVSSLTLFTINDALMAHAPGDRFGMLYELFGTQPTLAPTTGAVRGAARPAPDSEEARLLREAQRVRLEAGLAEQPDWLVVLDRGAATGGEGKAAQTLPGHAGVAATTAWQQGRVFYLDPAAWYIATGGYQGLLHTLKAFDARLGAR